MTNLSKQVGGQRKQEVDLILFIALMIRSLGNQKDQMSTIVTAPGMSKK